MNIYRIYTFTIRKTFSGNKQLLHFLTLRLLNFIGDIVQWNLQNIQIFIKWVISDQNKFWIAENVNDESNVFLELICNIWNWKSLNIFTIWIERFKLNGNMEIDFEMNGNMKIDFEMMIVFLGLKCNYWWCRI